MKKNLMISLVFFIVAFGVTACTSNKSPKIPINPTIADLDLSHLSVVREEVSLVTNAFYDKYKKYDAHNLSDFYSSDALIDLPGGRFTPKKFEDRKRQQFSNLKMWHVSLSVNTQSMDVFPGGVVVKSLFVGRGKYVKKSIRYFTWNKINEEWKLIAHTKYHPGTIDENFKSLVAHLD